MKPHSGALAGSVVLHAVVALILSMARFAAPIQPRAYESISLYPPRAEQVRPAVPRHRPVPPLRTFVPPTARSIKLPNLAAAPSLHNPVSPAVSLAVPAIATLETPPVIPAPAAAASPFTTAAAIQPPRNDRQTATRTGMFSDAANRLVEDHGLAEVQVGSFDRAAGGFAGGSPVPAGAPSSPAGFEAAVPARSPERSRRLHAGGFSDLATAGPAGSARAPAAARIETQLEILSKPRPVYSEAARRLQVEGEVLLEAAFRASGQIQVLRVIRGLGHGLDESAIQAAGGIRFRPATASGIPVDTLATVRITFQLAN